MSLFKITFFIFLLFTSLNGVTKEQLTKEYKTLKSEYLKSVLNGNKQNEIKTLEKLIKVGSQIKEDTTKYKSELNRLNKSQPKKVKPQKSQPTKKLISKKVVPKETVTKSQAVSEKWAIKSIKNSQNSIIINFNQNINKNYIKFSEFKKNGKFADVFKINGSVDDTFKNNLKIAGVEKIIVSKIKPKKLIITLLNSYNLKTIYIVNKRQIIIKVLDGNIKDKLKKSVVKGIKKQTAPILVTQTKKHSGKIVVIDPGHGGKDAGATGKGKKYEKIVTLKVSKYLYKVLKDRGYKVYLTRTTDKFIELRDRTKFSNNKKANIFVSIHVNSIGGRERATKLQGIETFFLSPARSERAKRVAAKENKGDMNAMNMDSQMSFLTILNQSKITESNKLAIDIQQNLLYSSRQLYKDVVDGGVREGPFWVLVGAQMPSVLVELGYVSHPKESIRLFNDNYQNKLAEGLANGIDAYFDKNQY